MERSRDESSNVGRRKGRPEVNLRRMRAHHWRREVDRSRFSTPNDADVIDTNRCPAPAQSRTEG